MTDSKTPNIDKAMENIESRFPRGAISAEVRQLLHLPEVISKAYEAESIDPKHHKAVKNACGYMDDFVHLVNDSGEVLIDGNGKATELGKEIADLLYKSDSVVSKIRNQAKDDISEALKDAVVPEEIAKLQAKAAMMGGLEHSKAPKSEPEMYITRALAEEGVSAEETLNALAAKARKSGGQEDEVTKPGALQEQAVEDIAPKDPSQLQKPQGGVLDRYAE